MKLNHLGSLITVTQPDGSEQCLGYLFNFQGHGVYSPDGKVEVATEHVEAHNNTLAQAELDGLDNHCNVGQCGTFYWSPMKGVTTFTGVKVADYTMSEKQTTITFRRNGKVFRGRIQKDADCFNFRRIK